MSAQVWMTNGLRTVPVTQSAFDDVWSRRGWTLTAAPGALAPYPVPVDTLGMPDEGDVPVRRGESWIPEPPSPSEAVLAAALPDRYTIDPIQPPNQVVNGWQAAAYLSGNFGNRLAYNGSNALNDEWRWWLPLKKGTWRLALWSDKSSNRGIASYDVSLDGGPWTRVMTYDGYSSSTYSNVQFDSDFAVPQSCAAVLRLAVFSKNDASTGWYFTLLALELVRVA